MWNIKQNKEADAAAGHVWLKEKQEKKDKDCRTVQIVLNRGINSLVWEERGGERAFDVGTTQEWGGGGVEIPLEMIRILN